MLSPADGRPMYLQIMEQIKHKIAAGDWPPGRMVPSIRQLAVDLRISVITVRRAYQELEREGVILTRAGKGSFVAENLEPIRAGAREELTRHLKRSVQLGKAMGLSLEALTRQLKDTFQDEER